MVRVQWSLEQVQKNRGGGQNNLPGVGGSQIVQSKNWAKTAWQVYANDSVLEMCLKFFWTLEN